MKYLTLIQFGFLLLPSSLNSTQQWLPGQHNAKSGWLGNCSRDGASRGSLGIFFSTEQAVSSGSFIEMIPCFTKPPGDSLLHKKTVYTMHFQHQNYQNSSNWFRQCSASLQGWNLTHLQPSEETRVRAGIGASLKSRGFAIRKADFKLYGPLAPLQRLPVNTRFVGFHLWGCLNKV